MDNGDLATSMPNGTLLACTWDTESIKQLYEYLSVELCTHKIDSILCPGINIHRSPLNGRNFEYFSEDPLLSGRTAAAICRGIAQSGCSATIKHFCCNSQEAARHHANSVVSERALREIYLKGFEIAVKEGDARSIMTSYNPTNGSWCASNYDLTTTILRNEWGYKGFVMTDWWANCSCEGEEPSKFNLRSMVRAQNDIYMVCPNAAEREHNIREGLADGFITLGDLQRNAINLLNYIVTTPTFFKYVAGGCQKPAFATVDNGEFVQACQFEDIKFGKGFEAEFGGIKDCKFDFEMVVNAGDRSQHNITVNIEGGSAITFAVNGTEGNRTTVTKLSGALEGKHVITVDAEPCVKILKLTIWNQR